MPRQYRSATRSDNLDTKTTASSRPASAPPGPKRYDGSRDNVQDLVDRDAYESGQTDDRRMRSQIHMPPSPANVMLRTARPPGDAGVSPPVRPGVRPLECPVDGGLVLHHPSLLSCTKSSPLRVAPLGSKRPTRPFPERPGSSLSGSLPVVASGTGTTSRNSSRRRVRLPSISTTRVGQPVLASRHVPSQLLTLAFGSLTAPPALPRDPPYRLGIQSYAVAFQFLLRN